MRWIIAFLVGLVLAIAQFTVPPYLRAVASNCDAAYPTVCIPSPPPDLDCKDVEFKNFKVLSPDPHRFDRDKDGIGCESRKR